MELPLLSPPWFYRALSELALYKSKPYYGFCKAFPHKDRAWAPPLEAKARGGGKCGRSQGRAFHRAGLNRELAMHDRKIQGMKLATAPLLCDLSPKTSVATLLYFFLLYFHSTTDKLAEKCRLGLLLEGVSAAEWCGESRPAQILWHNLPPHQIEKCE